MSGVLPYICECGVAITAGSAHDFLGYTSHYHAARKYTGEGLLIIMMTLSYAEIHPTARQTNISL